MHKNSLSFLCAKRGDKHKLKIVVQATKIKNTKEKTNIGEKRQKINKLKEWQYKNIENK